MSNIRVHVIVRGRVQGVFFRDSTREQAWQHKVCGWIRNRSDGGVEAVLAGERANVDNVVSFMRKGPEFARVDTMDITTETYIGEFDTFSIKRG